MLLLRNSSVLLVCMILQRAKGRLVLYGSRKQQLSNHFTTTSETGTIALES